MLSNTSSDFISDMEVTFCQFKKKKLVTDTLISNIENKIENFRLKEYSLKKGHSGS